MKELKFSGITQFGKTEGILRIIGKHLYFKYSDSAQSKQLIEQMKKLGADVTFSKLNDWVKVDFIKENKMVILKEKEFDIEEHTIEELEEFLYDFYKSNYEKLGMVVK